jgi:hypothetical protein
MYHVILIHTDQWHSWFVHNRNYELKKTKFSGISLNTLKLLSAEDNILGKILFPSPSSYTTFQHRYHWD